MKRIILTIILAVAATFVALGQRTLDTPNMKEPTPVAQPDSDATHLSAQAAMLYRDLQNLGHRVGPRDSALVARHKLLVKQRKCYVQAFVRMNEEPSSRDLRHYGLHPTTAGSLNFTALIPARRYVKFVDSKKAARIEMSTQININNLKVKPQ
ncbi:MAG: hypothetical protein IJ789_04030 [Bacteroidales bacterium]|nr:hypothetical protein [Bacteroidales bacterium]